MDRYARLSLVARIFVVFTIVVASRHMVASACRIGENRSTEVNPKAASRMPNITPYSSISSIGISDISAVQSLLSYNIPQSCIGMFDQNE